MQAATLVTYAALPLYILPFHVTIIQAVWRHFEAFCYDHMQSRSHWLAEVAVQQHKHAAACHRFLLPYRHPQLFAYVMAAVMVLHVLCILFTFWSVSFKALAHYQKVHSLEDADYVQVSAGL